MFKKVILLLLALMMCACRPIAHYDDNSSSYSILTYKSSAALTLLPFLNDDYSITNSGSVDTFAHAFDEGKHDIIIAPLNIGINSCLKGCEYKLLAILEYGTYNIISTKETLRRGVLGVLGQNTVNDYVIKYLQDSNNPNFEIKWYENIDALKTSFMNEELDGMILDEINFNYMKGQVDYDLYKTTDLNNEYEYKTGFIKYPVVGLFVLNEVIDNDQNGLVEFSRRLRSNINTYKNDKTTFNSTLMNSDISRLGYNDYKLIRESYNFCGLDFVYASSIYDELNVLMEICDIELNESVIIK